MNPRIIAMQKAQGVLFGLNQVIKLQEESR